MSRLVDFRNRIHHHFQREWLSPSQEQAYTRLRNLLKFQDAVNLCGPSGAGKTFLNWILAKEISVPICFLAHLEELPEEVVGEGTITSFPVGIAIVDPHPPERSIIRESLTRLRKLGYEKVIFVSDEPTLDQIPICQVILTTADVCKIHQNWESVAIPVTELQKSNKTLNLHTALREIALTSLNLKER